MPRQVSRGDTPHRVFSVAGVIQGVLVSACVTLCTTVLASVIMMLLDWKQQINTTVQWFNYVAIFLGGLYAGKRGGRLGWLHGGLTGFLYYILLTWTLTGNVTFDFHSTTWLMKIGAAFLAGAIGGMIGVNT